MYRTVKSHDKFYPYIPDPAVPEATVRKYLAICETQEESEEIARAADLLQKLGIVPYENFRANTSKSTLLVAGKETRMAECLRQFRIHQQTVYKRARSNSQTPIQALADIIRERNPDVSVEFL